MIRPGVCLTVAFTWCVSASHHNGRVVQDDRFPSDVYTVIEFPDGKKRVISRRLDRHIDEFYLYPDGMRRTLLPGGGEIVIHPDGRVFFEWRDRGRDMSFDYDSTGSAVMTLPSAEKIHFIVDPDDDSRTVIYRRHRFKVDTIIVATENSDGSITMNHDGLRLTRKHYGERVIEYPGGRVVTNKDNRQVIQYPAGDPSIGLRDSVREHLKEGPLIPGPEKDPDGRRIAFLDGCVFIQYDNGRTHIDIADDKGFVTPSAGSTAVQHDDGHRHTKYSDDREVIEFPGGSVVTRYPSGRQVTQSPASYVVTTRYPDGHLGVEYPNGHEVNQFSNHIEVVTSPDGSPPVLIHQKDGIRNIKHPSGQVESEYKKRIEVMTRIRQGLGR